jgi:predicted AAA+ superfamily ATPase
MPPDCPALPPEFAANVARIVAALERIAPPAAARPDFASAEAFVWQAASGSLLPVAKVNRVELALLKGIDRVRDQLAENTERFARGYPANNALLWGARGMGKSSLVKAMHADIDARLSGEPNYRPLKLIEIHREDIDSLPALMTLVRDAPFGFLVFCDDLSFDADDTSYKSLETCCSTRRRTAATSCHAT